ncbi:23S rRNA (uracil1939-C5)-methyltransferase [Flexibacter flexilis DSM 6793]|uniref:23S rRNA (Uracil1939-C5)-methyltransferase n=1 Tax=Flexibacter flexilis DSM 6793 TaxID=927664 RepID=A0A1I1H3Y3_9BACT|nr:23S rRNA (uracil(1939)-C(5))-methyltransferase RlmD [Flexibacter flexilis]SFC16798.1 23S rRNA (uracil1939-C5)-methyltransferase [Flexibacter flexilis DSM 6793]
MRKKQKQVLLDNITVLEMVAEGKCLARHEEKVIFIEGDAVPEDVVNLRITKQKSSFAEAQVVSVVKPSPLRQQPFCEHFGTCGGCKWQHLSYDKQLFFKQKQVKDNLERIGKVELPEIQAILPAPETTYYRNKLEFTFSDKRWLSWEEVKSDENHTDRNALGFHIPRRFDKILDINHCWLQPDPSNAIRLAIKAYAEAHDLPFFNLLDKRGLLRLLVIRTAQSTGQIMVIVQFYYNDRQAIAGLMTHLQENFPQITSLQYVINPKGNETFHDLEVNCWHGQPYIEEEMEGLRFRVGPKSFYQTNSLQAYNLYKVTRDMAQLTGNEVVYDLYTGTGTIANFVARQAKQVIGVEYVEMAIEDAKINSQINGIDNTLFYAGDMKDVLNDDFVNAHARPDVIITDPPRAGMHADVVAMLLRLAPQRIVYVSCNPATQARDLALLDEKYRVTAVQPVDMFPHTYHVENVVALERKD